MKKQKISATVLSKGERWYAIVLDGKDEKYPDFLLIDENTKDYELDQHISLFVTTTAKKKNNYLKWFHIAVPKSEINKHTVIGVGCDFYIYPPCTNNIIVKDNRAFRILDVSKESDGWKFGYKSKYWWKIICEDITDTPKGKYAIKENMEVDII